MHDKTFYIKTFGCQMNIRDSEIMALKLTERGYVERDDIEDVSLIVLNTCSVRAKAEQKVFSMLGALRRRKKQNPQLKICVAGCVAQQEGQRILERMDHVDLVIGTQHIYKLADLIEQSIVGKTVVHLSDSYEIPRFLPRSSAVVDAARSTDGGFQFSRFVTIMQGCNNFCTYCVVPHTRGREVSRLSSHIIDEIEQLVDSGVSEITLLGQNVNSYGISNPVTTRHVPYSFPHLLRDVAKIPGLKRLRFTTSNPKDLSAELINCFAEIENLCPQFHLPVQSGSDPILKRMNRKYTVADYLDKVHRLRRARPDIALTTDMIIGFPGETAADFAKTMDLLEQVRFHGSFSFKYSDRPRTRAATLDDKLDESTKSQRLQHYQKRQDEISLERNREYIGTIAEVLVEGGGAGQLMGRTATNHVVHVRDWSGRAQPGEYLDISIVGAGPHSLQGRQYTSTRS